MKIAIVYGSTHGKTTKVVRETAAHLNRPLDLFNVRDVLSAAELVEYDLLLFFAPTYGDEELQSDMEAFLLRCELNLSGKHFAICELGSYYGYEDFAFGALRILREHLLNWVDYLNGKINEHFRHCHA